MVDADRPKWVAIDRNEQRMLSHREISSRSERLSVCLERRRSGGRIPPVGEITEKTEEDSRSNRRPIALIGSPACQRSQISDRWLPSNKCDVAVSYPHSILDKRLECCADQLNPPPKADVGLGSSPVLAHPLTCVASLDVRWDRDAECEYCPIAARRSRSCDL
jgi:hypothetical protein